MLPNENGGILLTCIAATSGIGRMIFGKVADLPNVNRILLQQISFGNTGCRVFNGGVARFFLKINIGTQRILFNFENWCSGEVSKSAKI